MRHHAGDLAKAQVYLEKAAEIAPRDLSIRHSLANLDRARSMRTDNPVLRQAFRTSARKRLSGLTKNTSTNAYGFHTTAVIALDELKEIIEAVANGADDPLKEQQVINTAKRVAGALTKV